MSIHFVLGLLLATTFASVGLLGLWAGLSKWHWFVRSMVVAVAFLPLVLIPAYEVLLIVLTQTVVCATGCVGYRIYSKRQQDLLIAPYGERPGWARYLKCSITDLLLSAVLVAVLTALFVEMNRAEALYDWTTYVVVGTVTGLTVLASAWFMNSSMKIGSRIMLCFVATAVTSAVVTYFDWWSHSITDSINGSSESSNWLSIWLPVYLSIFLTVIVAYRLLRRTAFCSMIGLPASSIAKSNSSRFSTICLPVLVLALACFPFAACWKLMNPRPVPQIEFPEPNGYDTLVSAGKMFDSPILNFHVNPTSTQQLADEVDKYAAAYELAALGLTQEYGNTRGWKSLDIAKNNGSFRRISSAFSMKCELARQQDRHEDAADCALKNIELGITFCWQGLITDHLNGASFERLGRIDLFACLRKLDAEKYREVVNRLLRLESQRESFDSIVERDAIWSESAYGWQGHFMYWVMSLAGERGISDYIYSFIIPKDLAEQRLIVVELALHAYREEKSGFPNSLSDLGSVIPKQMMEDPFGDGQTFVYRTTSEGYVVYSRGLNRQDDGGHSNISKQTVTEECDDISLSELYK